LNNRIKMLSCALCLLSVSSTVGAAPPEKSGDSGTIQLRAQGSFTVGGTVISDQDGMTFHGDHAYAFYQIPEQAKPNPILMIHGHSQYSKTWETTPDGRDGFQNIFLKKNYAVFLSDQPRRGDAGNSTIAMTVKPTADEKLLFGLFRLGYFPPDSPPKFYPGVQFDHSPATLNQYFRQNTPDTGPFNIDIVSDALASVVYTASDMMDHQKVILFSHSQGGGVGWFTAMKSSDRIAAIVCFEGGSNYPFPDGQVPEPRKTGLGPVEGVPVPMSQFKTLTHMPILIIYGDNIEKASETGDGGGNVFQDSWYWKRELAKDWVEVINDNGGKAKFISLPELGIKGNTHFAFSDLNNVEIARLVEHFLENPDVQFKP